MQWLIQDFFLGGDAQLKGRIKLNAKTVDEDPASCKRWISRKEIKSQAAQAHYVWVRASEVNWSEYTRIISALSDAK